MRHQRASEVNCKINDNQLNSFQGLHTHPVRNKNRIYTRNMLSSFPL